MLEHNRRLWRLGAPAVCVLLMMGCGPSQEPTESGGAPPSAGGPATLQVPLIEVAGRPVPVTIEVTGQVTAVYQATLAGRIQGMIEEVRVREGSVVRKGQTLVVLDNRDLQAELSRATAELDSAKAHRVRIEDLYRKDAVSKQELENAVRGFRVAEAARKSVLAQLSYTIVKAPFDAVVTEKKVEAGELASPGLPLLKVEDPAQLRLEATVAESDVRLVSVGSSLPVVIDALGAEPLKGTVSQILPAGDPHTHTFTIKVDLPHTSGLKSGMFGRLRLEKGLTTTLLLPKSALVERGETAGVFVVGHDQTARLRWVKTGRLLEQGVEILSGVDAGERVIMDGTKGRDGALVQEPPPVAGPSPAP